MLCPISKQCMGADMSEFDQQKPHSSQAGKSESRERMPDGSIRIRKRVRKKRDREGAFGKNNKSNKLVKVVSILLLLLTIFTLSYSFYRYINRPKQFAGSRDIKQFETDDFTVAEEKWIGKSPREIADGFINAKSIAERLEYVNDPIKVKESMQNFYEVGLGKDEEIESIVKFPVMNRPQDAFRAAPDFENYVVIIKGDKKRLLAIVKTVHGCKVDFPSYARTCSASWADILEGKVKEADVRVLIGLGNYFNYAYMDDQKWGCLAMTSSDLGGDIINVYFDKSNAIFSPLLDAETIRSRRVFLRIKSTSPESLSHKQFELVEVLSPDWTYP